MADAEIRRHVDQAIARWPLTGVTIIHCYGHVVPGDNIVLVLTTSAHRQAAFQGAEFLMDYSMRHSGSPSNACNERHGWITIIATLMPSHAGMRPDAGSRKEPY